MKTTDIIVLDAVQSISECIPLTERQREDIQIRVAIACTNAETKLFDEMSGSTLKIVEGS